MNKPKIGHSALTWNVLADPPQLEKTIFDCARIGFAGTETGGFVADWWHANRPGQLKQHLTDHNQVMACLFEFGDWIDPDARADLIESGRRWATGVQELGGTMLMLVPGNRREQPPYGLDDFARMAETMNEVGRIAHEAGADATVHPHWGTMAESRLEIDTLLDHLDPHLVGFAPDTGQIAKGGSDPMITIDRWAERVRHVHLKDLSRGWAAMHAAGVPMRSPEGYCELGEGGIDFAPLWPILDRIGYAGWLMAELDEATRPADQAAKISWDFLSNALSGN